MNLFARRNFIPCRLQTPPDTEALEILMLTPLSAAGYLLQELLPDLYLTQVRRMEIPSQTR